MCGLYLNPPVRAIVLSVDEKTGKPRTNQTRSAPRTRTSNQTRYLHLLDDTIAAGLEATVSIPLFRTDRSVIGAVGVGWSGSMAFPPLGSVPTPLAATSFEVEGGRLARSPGRCE